MPCHITQCGVVAHVTGGDATGLLDVEWWRRAKRSDWREVLNRKGAEQEGSVGHNAIVHLRECTYAERPFGDEMFVSVMAEAVRTSLGSRQAQASEPP